MSFGKPTLPSGGIGSGPLKVEKWKVLSHAEEVWKYALGKLSAVEVQEFASAAWMHLKCKLSRGLALWGQSQEISTGIYRGNIFTN